MRCCQGSLWQSQNSNPGQSPSRSLTTYPHLPNAVFPKCAPSWVDGPLQVRNCVPFEGSDGLLWRFQSQGPPGVRKDQKSRYGQQTGVGLLGCGVRTSHFIWFFIKCFILPPLLHPLPPAGPWAWEPAQVPALTPSQTPGSFPQRPRVSMLGFCMQLSNFPRFPCSGCKAKSPKLGIWTHEPLSILLGGEGHCKMALPPGSL